MLRSYTHTIEVAELAVARPVAAPVDVALYDTFSVGQGNAPDVKRLVNNPLVRRVAVYTWNFQPWLTRETLEGGVSAYLSKSLPAAQLVDAITIMRVESQYTQQLEAYRAKRGAK